MPDAACVVQSMIPILAYEATRYPAKREVALAWLKQAAKWARTRGFSELAEMAAKAHDQCVEDFHVSAQL